MDLDLRMAPAFPNYVPAALFYRVRTEERPSIRRGLARDLVARLLSILERHSCAIMPVHVRYHWTTAVVRRVAGRLTTVVYDSARHPATARDITSHFTRDLGLARPVIVAHAKQFRGSAECGLHVFFVGAWAAYGTRPLPQAQLTPPRYVSLHAWRALLTECRPLTQHLTALLAAACPDFASMIGFDDVVRGGAPTSAAIPLSPPADGPEGALGLGPVRYSLDVPEEAPPVAHRTRARRSAHDADAQRAAAATFDPASLTEEFVVQTPVPLSWFLSRAASAGLSGATVALVREFYHHCDPGGGEQATVSLARLTSATADSVFWASRGGCRSDRPLLRLFRDCATQIVASVRARAAAQEDKLHMAYRAFQRHTYLTDTAVDAPILDAVFRDPPATGWSYLPCRALTWWEGRCTLPAGIGWDPGTLTSKVATVAHIAPEQHFVAFAYAGGAIVVRDSWHGAGATGARFDARGAAYGEATLRWAGVFASFLRRHCGLPVQPEAVYASCRRQQETECGVEAVNNTLQTIYALTEPGTLTRAHIREAHNFYLGLSRARVEPADRPSFRWSVLPSCAPTTRELSPVPDPSVPSVPVPSAEATCPPGLVSLPEVGPGRPPPALSAAEQSQVTRTRQGTVVPSPDPVTHREVTPPAATHARASTSPTSATEPSSLGTTLSAAPRDGAPGPGSARVAPRGTCRDCSNPRSPNHVCGGFCHWHHPAILETTKGTDRRCGCATTMRRGCRLPALEIAGVHTCWVHASLAQRHAVLRVLDPEGEPQWDAVSTGDTCPTGPSADTVLFAPREGAPAMRHNEVERALRDVPRGSHIRLSMARRGAHRVQCVARLLRAPARSALGEAEVLARWCDKCCQFESQDPAYLQLPDPDFTYFTLGRVQALPEFASSCGYEDDDDVGSDYGDEAADPSEVDALHNQLDDPARATLASMDSAPAGTWRVLDAKRWHPLGKALECPRHVHPLVWSGMSPKTRQSHLRWIHRIRHLPDEFNNTPLPKAVVEMVLREARKRHWAWSTISSSLSTVASALRDLQYYVPSYNGAVIDIRTDPYFRGAASHATRKARVTALRPQKSAPLSYADFDVLESQLRGSDAWYLLQLAWHLAARVGDTRRLDPENVRIADAAGAHGNVAVEALFTEGKGAFFWGPYTIHSTMPAPVAKQLKAFFHERRQAARRTSPQRDPGDAPYHAFSQTAQRELSVALGRFPDHSCRSIRRGALVCNARAGATDAELQLLSGHKRRDTLLRYLGWGHESTEAAGAAASRATKLSRAVTPMGGDVAAPMKMGRWSGFNGERGRRVRAPPSLFPRQAPPSSELGLQDDYDGTQDAFKDWTLHAHAVSTVNLPAVRASIESDDLRAAFDGAVSLLQSAGCYGIADRPLLTASQVPVSKFTHEQWTRFLEVGKIRPLGGQEIRSGVRGFAVPQPAKRRWRPVFETLYNPFFQQSLVPPLSYPSRVERRRCISGYTYRLELDHFAWFDQFPLLGVGSYHVVRSAMPIRWDNAEHELFCLERLPMGATQSCGVANTTTWALMEPIIRMDGVFVTSMVDNVIICSNEPDRFVEAVRLYLTRAQRCSADLNDIEVAGRKVPVPSDPDDILRLGAQLGSGPAAFLGEEYVGSRVRNQPRKVAKLMAAFARMRDACDDPRVVVTRRQLASFVGLCSWMANTLNVSLREHWDVLRLFSRVAQQVGSWDMQLPVTPRVLDVLTPLYTVLAANQPVVPHCPPLPSLVDDDYAAVAIVDASGTGYGAYVRFTDGRIFEVMGGWHGHLRHSAWAEPIGGLKIVEWLRGRLPRGARIAVVTDHGAMCHGQLRPGSATGGFSLAYHLNSFFRALYSFSPDAAVFYVEGPENIADAPSRAARLGSPQIVKEVFHMQFPPLAAFFHPFLQPRARPWWCV